MRYRLKVYSIFEVGNRKDAQGNPHQEDCTFPLPSQLRDSDRTFILCDGMGGHDAGEIASSTVCQAMGDYILNDGHDAEGYFTDTDLNNAIEAAFLALDEKDTGAEKKMGTTMALLKFHNAGATIAHMGDSRVYHIRPGKDGEDTKILYVTPDHSLINDLIKIGELSKEEAKLSKQKNVITRAMQPNMERAPKADVKHISDIKEGDYFYLCSDGMLEKSEMEDGSALRNIFSEKIETAERKVAILKDVTFDNRDNHTAIIIKVEEVIKVHENDSNKWTGIIEPEETTAGARLSHNLSVDKRKNPENIVSKQSSSKNDKNKKTGTRIPKLFLISVLAGIIAVSFIFWMIYSPSFVNENDVENVESQSHEEENIEKSENKEIKDSYPNKSNPKTTEQTIVNESESDNIEDLKEAKSEESMLAPDSSDNKIIVPASEPSLSADTISSDK